MFILIVAQSCKTNINMNDFNMFDNHNMKVVE